MASVIEIDTLTTLIVKQIDGLIKLQQLLDEEYAALRDNRVADIESTAKEKLDALNELQQWENKQLAVLQKLSPGDGRTAKLTEIVLKIDPDDTHGLQTLAGQLNKLARQCSDCNRVNGAIIHSKHHFSQQVLAALHGQNAATKENLTYDRSGTTSTGTHRQTCVKA